MLKKECSDCKEIKNIAEYYTQIKSNSKGSYEYVPPYCKECSKIRARKWSLANPEIIKKSKRKYNVTPNGKKSGSLNSKRRRESGETREWQRNNKDKLKQYNENRKNNKSHDISELEWNSCKKYFDDCCAYCGIDEKKAKKEQGQVLHKEHVDSEGSNDLSNCVPACRSCNSRKWLFALDEFYNESNEDYSESRMNRIQSWLEVDYFRFINKVS